MIAYYVHDAKKETDTIIMPDMGCAVPVDAERMQAFISVDPSFARWSGDSCADLAPEDFGTVIATREEGGDVCVLDAVLWRERIAHHLGEVKPATEFDK
jgi:hypothetical protein